jgi:hypothetical protein
LKSKLSKKPASSRARKMEAMYVPLECGYLHQTAQHYIPEDGTLHKAERL